MSKVVNGNFYKTILRFVLLYRSCLNKIGWERRRDHYKRADMCSEDHKLNELIAKNKGDEEEEAKDPKDTPMKEAKVKVEEEKKVNDEAEKTDGENED
jgi:hypothetical protein